jgi:hypothetical protein
MPLSDIISVTISILRAAVTAAGFGVPLVLGSSNRFAERYRAYSSSTGLASMLVDGFLSSDPEYQAVQDMLAGDKVPQRFVIGRRLTPVAQTQLFVIPAAPGNTTLYRLVINGENCDYTTDGSATQTELRDGILAAINAAVGSAVTATTATNDVLVTADDPGTPFSYSIDAAPVANPITLGASVAGVGVADDIAAIKAAGASFYGIMQTSRDIGDIANLAEWVQSNTVPPYILMAQTSEADSADEVLDSNGTDIANVLATAGYSRTALWWHSEDTEYLDAAILGRELPVDPGSDNWALKELTGITPDDLSQTQKDNLIGPNPGEGKNANIYYALTDQNNITFRGSMASGDWIDVIRFVDFLTARISEEIANLMLTVERVNFDENGLQLIASQLRGVLQAAKNAQKLSSFEINVPDISEYTASVRAARTLDPPITWSAQLSGALLNVSIEGSVVE